MDTQKLIEKIFREYDDNNNGRFSRTEFPKVIKLITDLIGAEYPTEDDVEDIFNLLDVNGDNTIDRKELESLFRMFFTVLEEKNIKITVSQDSDIVNSQ